MKSWQIFFHVYYICDDFSIVEGFWFVKCTPDCNNCLKLTYGYQLNLIALVNLDRQIWLAGI